MNTRTAEQTNIRQNGKEGFWKSSSRHPTSEVSVASKVSRTKPMHDGLTGSKSDLQERDECSLEMNHAEFAYQALAAQRANKMPNPSMSMKIEAKAWESVPLLMAQMIELCASEKYGLHLDIE
jgi:hypothetical protein